MKTTCEISDTKCFEEWGDDALATLQEGLDLVEKIKGCYVEVVGGDPEVESMDLSTWVFGRGVALVDALPPDLLAALKVCAAAL